MQNIPNLNERYRRRRQPNQGRGGNTGGSHNWGWVWIVAILFICVVGGVLLVLLFPADRPSPTRTATAVTRTTTAEARMTATARASLTTDSGRATATAVARTATAEARVTATVEPRKTATAKAKTTVAKERNADQAAIENVVRRYSEEIKIDNVTYLDSSTLRQVLIDPVLKRQKQSVCWLKNEGYYYTYSNRRFTINSVTLNNDRQATVLARIQENRVLRNQDGSIHKDYGYDDYRAIYQLEKMSNNKWYIYCFQALDDDESAHCKVKLEGDDPCR